MNVTNAKLIILDGPQVGKQYSLETLPVSIGRTDASTAIIPDSSISRRHAEIMQTSETISIKDLGSKNGFELNGVKVVGSAVLYDGDRITIGKVKLRCIMPHNTRPAPPQKEKVVEEAVPTAQVKVSNIKKGTNANIALAIVLGLGLVLAVLALVLVIDDTPAPPEIYTLSVGEQLLLPTRYDLKQVTVSTENQRVLRVRPDKRLANVLWLKGMGIGDSTLRLSDSAGKLLVEFKAIVRGRYRDIESDLGLMDLDVEDRLRLAKSFEQEALALQRDSLLESVYTYDKALAALREIAEHEEFYITIQKKRSVVLLEFETLFNALGQEYKMSQSNGNKAGMYAALKKIKILVPDTTHTHYQRAKYYYTRLQAKTKK